MKELLFIFAFWHRVQAAGLDDHTAQGKHVAARILIARAHQRGQVAVGQDGLPVFAGWRRGAVDEPGIRLEVIGTGEVTPIPGVLSILVILRYLERVGFIRAYFGPFIRRAFVRAVILEERMVDPEADVGNTGTWVLRVTNWTGAGGSRIRLTVS